MEGPCQACGAPGARVRRCTKQRLCPTCRTSPEHRVITGAELRRKLSELDPAELLPLRAGFIPNPKHCAFARMPVYFWKDLALFLLDRGLEFE
jgi:hypothetical protein